MQSEASRIANVTVAFLSNGDVTRADRRRVEVVASRLFEEVVLLDAEVGFSSDCVAAIEAARGERILLVEAAGPQVCAETLLALVCWPESEIVQPVDRAGHALPISIWRRGALVAALRERAQRVGSASAPSASVASRLASQTACERVSLAELGLEDAPQALFDGGEDPGRCSI